MGVMGSPVRFVLALVVVSALVSCTLAFAGYDGLPRPAGMDDRPTTTLGAKPAVKYAGKPANCIWYSWENFHYDPKYTKNCSTLLWASLTADPSGLEGYMYYAPTDTFYDPSANEYLCTIGCFDLSATGGPSPAPSVPVKPTVSGTPPLAMSPPPATPPPVMTPPAVAPSTPSPMMVPPPPATLFRPPPPGLPLPPPSVVSPTTGPGQAPGPGQAQANAGSAIRIFSASSVLAISAAVFGFIV